MSYYLYFCMTDNNMLHIQSNQSIKVYLALALLLLTDHQGVETYSVKSTPQQWKQTLLSSPLPHKKRKKKKKTKQS